MSTALLALNARTFVSLRKHRNYRLFFSGQIVSVCGTWMQDTALPWLIIQRTHSALAVGLLLFCRFAPFTLFGLFSGVLADRFDNRRFMIGTQTSSMVIASTLAILTLAGTTPEAVIFVLAFLGGSAVVFDAPSRQTLTYQLVGRDELQNAVALSTSLFNIGRVVGPAVAGVVIAAVGVGACFVLNAASFLAILVGLLLMRPSEFFPIERSGPQPQGRSAIKEGLHYAFHEPRLRLILGITAVVGVSGFNFRVLVPILASKAFHVGAGVFGVLFACFGVGALAGALVSAGATAPTFARWLRGIGAFGAAVLALAFFHSVVAAAVLLFITGIGFTQWSTTGQAMLQLSSPDALRGRIVSIYLFFFAGLTPFGSLLAGWLATVGGATLAFGVAGVVALCAIPIGIVEARKLDRASLDLRSAHAQGDVSAGA